MCRIAILTVISLLAASGMLSAQEPKNNKAQKVQVLTTEGQPNAVLCTVYPPKLPSGTTQAGLVVHLYGRRGSHTAYNISRPPYAVLRQLLAERGYWIVVPELGGDHWMNDKAVKTLDGIIAGMIATAGIDPARVHILGNSMGAGSGLVYVSQRPGVVRSICAMYPMTDFNAWLLEKPDFAPSVTAAYFDQDPKKVQSNLTERSPMQHIDAFAKVPVLLLHGDADSAVPVHHSRDFAAALTAKGYPVTYHEEPGIDHADVLAEKYQTEMADFLTDKTDRAVAESKKALEPKKNLTVDLGGGETIELLLIRSGSSTTDSEKNNNDKPANEGTIAKPFAIGKFQIAPDQWRYRGLADGWSLYTSVGNPSGPGVATPAKKGAPSTAQQPKKVQKPAMTSPVANSGKNANAAALRGRVVAVSDDGKKITLEVMDKGSPATTHTARINGDTTLNYDGVQTGEHRPTVGFLAEILFSKNQPEVATAIYFNTKKGKTGESSPGSTPSGKKPAPETTGKGALEGKLKKQPPVAP